jgi:hypothetical protein
MATDTRTAQELEALREQPGSRMMPEQPPDARTMGAQSASYTEPTIDPQWIDAWKMFPEPDGFKYGVPVKLPRNQWAVGGPNALMNLRHPDGDFWFTTLQPKRLMPVGTYPCFVGACQKKARTRILLLTHVRSAHFQEAEAYKEILLKIEQQVAKEDSRLQAVLASMEGPEAAGVPGDELVAVVCPECGKAPPEEHENPAGWLQGHMLAAHKTKVGADAG